MRICRIQEHAHLLNLALLGSQAPWVVKILAHQYDTATRTTEGLVSCRSNDVRILQWGLTTKKGEVKKMSMLLNSAVFPGEQGGPLEHVIAAKAVADVYKRQLCT